MSISAVIIARNEEEMINECLDSVMFCDEIIVIDNNSTDRTGEIARKKGAKVYSSSEVDFSALRNQGLKRASGEWILYVDADERVSPDLQENIFSVVSRQKNTSSSAYLLKRKNFYYGTNEWPYQDRLERLFKKEDLKGWHGKIHESPVTDGEKDVLEGFLIHYSHRNLTEMLAKTIEWSQIEAELRLDSNHPKMTWWRFPRVMATGFFDYYIKQGGYKVGTAGIIEGVYQSFSIFITYARLWEMQNKKERT